VAELAGGRFQPVLDDPEAAARREAVERLVLCSGKVHVDLMTSERPVPDPKGAPWVAVARVELLYPFPRTELEQLLASYPNLTEVVWLQEEPQNMGAWSYIWRRLAALLPEGLPLRYIGRPERAATAEGSASVHAREQKRIVEAAFGGERRAKIETRGVQHVG
jgi:2-oxoglutarate dehydrogenase E1 component